MIKVAPSFSLGFQFQPPAVVFDDAGGNAQAQAGAFLLGAEKGLKDLVPDGFGDARTVVAHPDDHRRPQGRARPFPPPGW